LLGPSLFFSDFVIILIKHKYIIELDKNDESTVDHIYSHTSKTQHKSVIKFYTKSFKSAPANLSFHLLTHILAMRDDNGPKIGWLPKHKVKKQSSPTWKHKWEMKI
jgi:hypothetical protein